MSDSLRPHGLKHASPPCPSPTPRVYSDSCPWSRWYHPPISSSVVPFSSCLQSFPASGSFQMSHSCSHDLTLATCFLLLSIPLQKYIYINVITPVYWILTALLILFKKIVLIKILFFLCLRMVLEESICLTSDYTTKLQSSRQYGIDTKTDI